jgi:hypothetical protein
VEDTAFRGKVNLKIETKCPVCPSLFCIVDARSFKRKAEGVKKSLGGFILQKTVRKAKACGGKNTAVRDEP